MPQSTFVQIAVWDKNLYALDKAGQIWKCTKQQDDVCAWQPVDQTINTDPLTHSEAVGSRAF